MSNDIQKRFDKIRKNSKLHELNETNANRVIANITKAADEQYRKNLSNGKKGGKRPDMTGTNNPAYLPHVRDAKKARLIGVPKSKEQIEKYKATMQLKPEIICPYCGFVGRNQGNMNRYHLNKYCQTKCP